MDSGSDGDSEARFAAYVEQLGTALGHADRQDPLRDYCLGLLMPIARKSVEPMAAVTAPGQVAAKHQSLLHFVGNAPWSDTAMLAKVSDLVLPAIERSGPIEAWIIDDTGFPKKGRHSVGVTRQYCGQLGKQDNCQVAVSLSLANHHGSLPVAHRLYLPEEWARDRERREKARVPDTIGFRTKPEIALEEIKSACAAGLPRGVVLMDAGYGNDTELRTQVTTLDLSYVVGIGATTAEWLLIEWPQGEPEPTKYWLSTMPEDIPFDRLVDLAKLRWRIERDYQELKQELGFGDYEGRGWRGFHHHATLCIAAYGFLIAERGALPPSGPSGAALLSGSTLSCDYRPRGAADPARTARAQLDCHDAPPSHRRPRPDATEMPLLQRADPQNPQNSRLLTQ